ncbi:hypothetical protein BO85DRAFT_446888 [Aspergillus piperis CBS 112811]|uniref:Uncharacterized protein n=1 Tax=Aspergillus piperis CBS 112811 TaxID=1448313 RepID=A0A8G1R6Y5_9EURO|nr:hypothetical protein BO85DRAFT_446888 [Aspergillus piperis CBS 112811]RAH60332.1 hypothetical protein BO85DRAFT_446888 [Aspergillus piperis CBS 112811]
MIYSASAILAGFSALASCLIVPQLHLTIQAPPKHFNLLSSIRQFFLLHRMV